jgi:hypothetical protein
VVEVKGGQVPQVSVQVLHWVDRAQIPTMQGVEGGQPYGNRPVVKKGVGVRLYEPGTAVETRQAWPPSNKRKMKRIYKESLPEINILFPYFSRNSEEEEHIE